jgi:hypothetical protein
MVMPQTAQTVFTVANIALCVIALVFAQRYQRSSHSAVGFLLLLAGALTVLNEPAVDILGLCWFATQGATPLFTAWGVTIPAFMLPVYCWYVGGQALIALIVMENGATRAKIFRLYGLYALIDVMLEVPALKMGIYAYYGNQPLRLLEFPCWWAICNGLMPIVMAAMVFRLQPLWRGPRRLLLVLIGPMAAGMTNGAIAMPVWLSLNSGAPLWATHVAAAVSLAMGYTLAFLVSQAVAVDRYRIAQA